MLSTTHKRTSMVRVEMVRERTLTYPMGETLGTAHHAYIVAQAVLGKSDREQFLVMHLSAKHGINSVEVVAVGTLNATLVHPREVFKGAILSNAAAIILAHNHPSGDPTPSPEDYELTKQLLLAGELLGIRVLDHLVVGDARYVSLRETTLLWANAS